MIPEQQTVAKLLRTRLESLIGIETIVGRNNVVYFDDGSYVYTNPGAMMQWIFAVAGIGAGICFAGVLTLIRHRSTKIN